MTENGRGQRSYADWKCHRTVWGRMTSKSKRSPRYRLILVVLIFLGLFLLSRSIGLTDWDAEGVRKHIEEAGIWGFFFYMGIFAGGESIHIPGIVFVGAGIVAYGKLLGFLLAFIASVVSVCTSFVVVRAIGGKRPFQN